MSRRLLLLVAALVVAALGTTLVFVYVNGINNRALADQKPVKVLVAKTLIASGTSAADAARLGAFELKDVAAASVAPGALSDITPISGQVALANIYAGEQILQQKFGTAGTTSSLPIPGDMIAVSLQLSDPARVAGFVLPGSSVAVFSSFSGNVAGGPSGQFTRILLPKALVVAVGPTALTTNTSTNAKTGQQNTEQVPKAILTLALSQADAERLIFASQQQGSIYFGLLSSNSKIDKGAIITGNNLFG